MKKSFEALLKNVSNSGNYDNLTDFLIGQHFSIFQLLVLIISVYFAEELPKVLNGSLSYAPALFVLLGLGIYHYQAQKQGKFLLLAASAVFFLSLFFRTFDQIICPYFPLGTHFLWHILNGALLYLAMQGFILNRSAVTKAT